MYADVSKIILLLRSYLSQYNVFVIKKMYYIIKLFFITEDFEEKRESASSQDLYLRQLALPYAGWRRENSLCTLAPPGKNLLAPILSSLYVLEAEGAIRKAIGVFRVTSDFLLRVSPGLFFLYVLLLL